jgi:hypothetical protein
MIDFLTGPSFHDGRGSWARALPEKIRSRLMKIDFIVGKVI